MDVAVQESGKWMWLNMIDVPESFEAIGQTAPLTELPYSESTEDLEITLSKLSFQTEQDEITDKVSRYLVIEVELTGRKERSNQLKWSNFRLLSGNLDVVEPEEKPEFLSQPLTKDQIPYGEKRKGQLAFKCPHGVNPLRLKIVLSKTKTLNIPLAGLLETEKGYQ